MLYGATLRAAHPHARILSIDTSKAAALPGVHAVLTHQDVPGRNRHGLVIHDWPVLCDDKVRYLGDAVAVVAADTPEIARRGAGADRGRVRAAARGGQRRGGSAVRTPPWSTRNGRTATCWTTSRCAWAMSNRAWPRPTW